MKKVIKRCDNGAGIIVLNFKDYIKAAETHLNSTHEFKNGESTQFFSKVQPEAIDEVAKKK